MTLAASLLLAAAFTRPLERVSSMDPAFSQSLYDSHAIGLVYETPLAVDYRARPYRLVPGFCELPEISSNGLCYVFRLRRPNGRLGAEDLVRSLERLRDPAVVSPNGWMMADVTTVRALSPAAVEIRLKRPVEYFCWLMAHSPSAVVGPNGEGTGPYRLAHWRKNHTMSFVRREPCADGFDTVRYLVIDDATTQWLMFLKGEIDFLGDVSRDNWDCVVGADGRLLPELAARGIRLHSMPSLDVLYIGINMRDPVLGPNRALRQALNAAFDFPAWAKFYNGRIVEANGAVPPGVEGRLESPFPYRYDPARAKKLLAQAGYPDGLDPKTGRRLVLTLTIGRASQESREAGELLASFYDRVGIRLELDFLTWDAFLKATNEGRVQLFRMGWVGDYPHVQNFLQLFYSPNASPGVNHANYRNPDFDRAYEKGDWKRCQEIVREDCPWVFTHFTVMNSLTGPRVGNYTPSVFSSGNEQYYKAPSTSSYQTMGDRPCSAR